jgi:hypothetical protein
MSDKKSSMRKYYEENKEKWQPGGKYNVYSRDPESQKERNKRNSVAKGKEVIKSFTIPSDLDTNLKIAMALAKAKSDKNVSLKSILVAAIEKFIFKFAKGAGLHVAHKEIHEELKSEIQGHKETEELKSEIQKYKEKEAKHKEIHEELKSEIQKYKKKDAKHKDKEAKHKEVHEELKDKIKIINRLTVIIKKMTVRSSLSSKMQKQNVLLSELTLKLKSELKDKAKIIEAYKRKLRRKRNYAEKTKKSD